MAHAQSPSPPPPAPVPATPGPRVTQFVNVFRNALQHTVRACSYEKFSSCFPTPAAKQPDILRSVHTQITTMIEEKAEREFEDILQEREVVAGLNDLERLVTEARSRETEGGLQPTVALHTLPPQTLYLAQLAPYLTKAASSLNLELNSLQSENEELADILQIEGAEIGKLISGLEAAVEDLEQANAALEDSVDATDLRKELQEVQSEQVINVK